MSIPFPLSRLGRGAARRRLGPILAGALLATLVGCYTVPVTGRSSFNPMTPADDVRLGEEAWQQVLAQERVIPSGPDVDMVRRIMERLVAVAGEQGADAGYPWEVALIDAPDVVNAFALPGGKMAVYTGILPVAGSEARLAAVMAHEVGHVVARHGTERVSTAMYAEGATELLLGLLDAGDYAQLASVGLEFLFLPYGRRQESEADRIGLDYMARAGYDPRAAIELWQRMQEVSGDGPPEFLSTHPSPETRIERLEEYLPRALELYAASQAGAAGG